MRLPALALLALLLVGIPQGLAADGPGRTGERDGTIVGPLMAWTLDRTLSAPATDDSRVFVLAYPAGVATDQAHRDGVQVVALDASTGMPLWETPLYTDAQRSTLEAAGTNMLFAQPIVWNGHVVVLDHAGVWMLQTSDGQVAAHPALPAYTGSPPAPPLVRDGVLHLLGPSADDPGAIRLQRLDLATRTWLPAGPLLWRDGPIPTLAGDATGLVFVRPLHGPDDARVPTTLVALDGLGAIVWTKALTDQQWSTPALRDGRIHLTGLQELATEERLQSWAFARADGATAWSRESIHLRPLSNLAIPGPFPPALDGNRAVVVHRNVEGLDPATGQVLWTAPLDDRAGGPARIYDDGIVVPLSSASNGHDGQVRAYSFTGSLLWKTGEPSRGGTSDSLRVGDVLVGDFAMRKWRLWSPDNSYTEHVLVAFGPDDTLPVWQSTEPAYAIQNSAESMGIAWQQPVDLNLDHVRIERLDGPTWVPVANVQCPSVCEDASWSIGRSGPEALYRAVPVDAAGNLGQPSNQVRLPPSWSFQPWSVTVAEPLPGATVSGLVTFRGTSFHDNGTPAIHGVQGLIEERYADGGTYQTGLGQAVPGPDGSWSFTWDSRPGNNGAREDGVYRVAFHDGPGRADFGFNLTVRNGRWISGDAEATLAQQAVVEGDYVDLNVTVDGSVGFRPAEFRLALSWDLEPEDLGNGMHASHGFGKVVAANVTADDGGFAFAIRESWELSTVGVTGSRRLRVEVEAVDEQGTVRLITWTEELQVTPDANASERAQRDYERRHPYSVPAVFTEPAAVGAGAGAVGVLGIAAFGLTEVGRYTLLRAAPFALFSRIRGPKLLEQRRRENIYVVIQDRPGVRFSELRRVTAMSNGSLTHHLQALEREGLIVRERRGLHLHLHVPGTVLQEIDPIGQRVLSILAAAPAITQADLARQLGMSRQALQHHVVRLRRLGILHAGRFTHGSAPLAGCAFCGTFYVGGTAVGTPCPRCARPLRAT